MKLTNWVRDTFIRSVMNEVPIPKLSKEEVQEAYVKAFPPEIKAIYEDAKLRKCLIHEPVNAGERYYGIVTGGLGYEEILKDFHHSKRLRKEAESKLRQIAYGCSTLKQLQTALPELIHHMPSENAPVKANLPAITGLMEDLKKAGFSGASK